MIRAEQRHCSRIVAFGGLLVALALAPAGCTTNGEITGSVAAGRSTAVAVESIEGLPSIIGQKLARDLSEAATARQIIVVTRGAQAAYRMRGYIASYAQQGQTFIAWAWDVYDAEQ